MSVFVWAFILWYLMYEHASKMHESFAFSNCNEVKKGEGEIHESSCLSASFAEPFFQNSLVHSRTEVVRSQQVTNWDGLSHSVYIVNIGGWKDQRRVLVDRLCARAASEEEKHEGEVTSIVWWSNVISFPHEWLVFEKFVYFPHPYRVDTWIIKGLPVSVRIIAIIHHG